MSGFGRAVRQGRGATVVSGVEPQDTVTESSEKQRAGRKRHHSRVNWSVNVAGDGNSGYAPSERSDSLFFPPLATEV